MKRQLLLAIISLWLPNSLFASDTGVRGEFGYPGYASFEVANSSWGTKLGVDITGDIQAVRIGVMSDDGIHGFSFKIIFRSVEPRRATALRGRYLLALPFYENRFSEFGSETSVALGYLDGEYVLPLNSYDINASQLLFGFNQSLISRFFLGDQVFGVKTNSRWSGASLMDDYGNLTQWDNYGLGASGFFASEISDWLKFALEAEAARKRYNSERYFFVEKWTKEYRFRSELVVSVNSGLDVIPLFNYRMVDIERNRRADLMMPEYGGRVVLKNVANTGSSAFVGGSYAPYLHREGNESVMFAGVNRGDLNAELYRRSIREIYSSFSYRHSLVGLRVSWNFGARDKLPEISDYGRTAEEKYEFYHDGSGAEDNNSLSRVQQAERLGTLRERNEWSGKNLKYIYATGFRYQDEVYGKRGGDCDEQACLNLSMDALNGYRGYMLAWWDFNKSYSGHGVELVQDPSTGDWFWDEYGMLAKIRNVSPGMSKEDVAAEAIRQNHRFSALPVDSRSNRLYFDLTDCSQPNTYNALTSFINLKPFSRAKERPYIEYGSELFTGKDFLFVD